jgi:hypothetical protein
MEPNKIDTLEMVKLFCLKGGSGHLDTFLDPPMCVQVGYFYRLMLIYKDVMLDYVYLM